MWINTIQTKTSQWSWPGTTGTGAVQLPLAPAKQPETCTGNPHGQFGVNPSTGNPHTPPGAAGSLPGGNPTGNPHLTISMGLRRANCSVPGQHFRTRTTSEAHFLGAKADVAGHGKV